MSRGLRRLQKKPQSDIVNEQKVPLAQRGRGVGTDIKKNVNARRNFHSF